MNKIKLSIAMVLWFTVVACATHYAVDPNANTVVTVQYDDEPERIVLPEQGCKPQLDCTDKTEEQCAVALVKDSQKYITEGNKMAQKKHYLSASVEYMQAMSRLVEAEIRLKRVAPQHPLHNEIRKQINYCRIQVKRNQWLRKESIQ